jgi:protein disulfide-isomerase A6
LGSQYNVRGVPSLKLFIADKSSPIDYNGGRSANEMMNFIFQQMKLTAQARLGGKKEKEEKKEQTHQREASKEVVIELTDYNFDQLVSKDDDAWFIEFFGIFFII